LSGTNISLWRINKLGLGTSELKPVETVLRSTAIELGLSGVVVKPNGEQYGGGLHA